MNLRNYRFNLGSFEMQTLFGLLRFILLLGIIWSCGTIGTSVLHNIDPWDNALWYREKLPFIFDYVPDQVLLILGDIFNSTRLKYMLTPLAASVLLFIAGANYVKDVYALKQFKPALNYVMSSMFGIFAAFLGFDYPRIVLDKTTVDDPGIAENLLRKIGGPGMALVEPGNAVVFRYLRGPGEPIIGANHFMAPFETIGTLIDLDEQQGDKDEITAMSRDGIVVTLKDVHIRYRLKLEVQDGKPVQRTISRPYPLSPDAFRNMISNLSINPDGSVDKWNVAVERLIVGNITDFIASHNIDYLTAPRNDATNPRIELRNEFFLARTQRALENLGAELLWIDVGHWEIVQDAVDEKRTALWASEWIGDAAVTRAYSEAIRQAYHDLGRAQAQAELILSIADALQTAGVEGNSRENIRRLLLARTAQVLDSLGDSTENRG